MKKETPGKREQKNIENNRLIIETAGRLFREKGYQETTMADIAKESGLAYGSIYHMYPSKRAIITAIYRNYFGEKIGLNDNREQKILAPVESIHCFLKEYERRWMQAGWAVVLNAYIENREANNYDLLNLDDQDVIKNELLEFMVFSGENGLLRSDITPEYATTSIFIFGRGLLFSWALNFGSYDLVEKSDPYWKIFLKGIFIR